jgi:phage RecT family recombinase
MPSQTKPSQPAPQNQALVPFQEAFDRESNAIANLLARDGDVARFRELILDAVAKDPKLMRCTPVSLIRAVRDMAKLNLEPVLGEAYLVPFWNKNANGGKGAEEAQLIIGYHGLQTLAFNSGFVTLIEGDVVHSNDEFSYVRGYPDTSLRHVPAQGDRGEYRGAWAMVWLRGTDRPLIGYLEEDRIEQRRLVSRSGTDQATKGPKGMWLEWPDEARLKTALRFTLNLAPKAVRARVASALDLEDAVDSLLQAAPERPRLEDGGKSTTRRRRIMGRLTGDATAGDDSDEIEGDATEVEPASDAPGAAGDAEPHTGATDDENAAGRGTAPAERPSGTCGATGLDDDGGNVSCNLRAGHLEEPGAPQMHRLLDAQGKLIVSWPAQA